MQEATFKNRQDAGEKLAGLLQKYRDSEAVILALPRGGVVVGAAVASELRLPLNIVVVRKVGHPANREYAVAAVSENGIVVKNMELVGSLDPEWLSKSVAVELTEARRRRARYWGDKPEFNVTNKIAIIVDDGLATGLTMLAAIKEVRLRHPQKIIVAVPVAPRETVEIIQKQADETQIFLIPDFFLGAVGAYYDEFEQVSDEEVVTILNNS